MRILMFLSAFSTLAAAFKTHFLPSSISKAQLLILNGKPIASEYRNQDTKAFYTDDYKGVLSAKAEYTTSDGTLKGFYSYVDADGKLQTVKYESSQMQGFQATTSNLLTAPVDTNRAPEPVKDTPEVELARKAHFDAYREAALKTALSPDNGNDEEIKESIDYNKNDQDHQHMQVQRQQHQRQQHHEQEQQEDPSQLQQNTRDLVLNHQREEEFMKQKSSVNDAGYKQDTNYKKMQKEQQQPQQQQQKQEEEKVKQQDDQYHHQPQQQQRHQMKEQQRQQKQQQQQQQSSQNHRLTTVYKLEGNLNIDPSPLSKLRTVYRINSIDSNAEFKLPISSSHGLTETGPLTILQTEFRPTLLPAFSYEPSSSLQYQYRIGTLNRPQYTLRSPTVLTSLPHIESIHLNDPLTQLHLGTTTYLSSHHLSGKSII